MTAKPSIRIIYCTQCQWLLRAGWMAQELLSTFGTELGSVALVPGTGASTSSRSMGTWCGTARPTAVSRMQPRSSSASATASIRIATSATPTGRSARQRPNSPGPDAASGAKENPAEAGSQIGRKTSYMPRPS